MTIKFIRDIMVLGQEDIVRKVEKLIPQFTKVCSHDLNSADPDRGETYFHDHPGNSQISQLTLNLQMQKKRSKWTHLDPLISSSVSNPFYIGPSGYLLIQMVNRAFMSKHIRA